MGKKTHYDIPDTNPGALSFDRSGSTFLYAKEGLYTFREGQISHTFHARPFHRGFPDPSIDLTSTWNVPVVAVTDNRIFICYTHCIPNRGPVDACIYCMDKQSESILWELSLPYGHGDVFPCNDEGCFVYCLIHSPHTSGKIIKLSSSGIIEWEYQSDRICGIGPNDISESVYLLVEKDLPPVEQSVHSLIQLHSNGVISYIDEFHNQNPCAMRFDHHNNLFLVLRCRSTSFIYRYSRNKSGTLYRTDMWEHIGSFLVSNWGLSPSGQYLAATDFIYNDSPLNGTSVSNRLILLSLQPDGFLKETCSIIEHAIEAQNVAPLVTDDGTVFSAWKAKPNNLIMKTSMNGSSNIIRKSKKSTLSIQCYKNIIYLVEGTRTGCALILLSPGIVGGSA